MSSSTLIRAIERKNGSHSREAADKAAFDAHPAVNPTRTNVPRAEQASHAAPRFGWKAAVAAVLVLAAVAVAVRQSRSHGEVKRGGVRHSDAPRVVTIGRPSGATLSNVVLPATIRPWQTATLHARVSGYLHSWRRDLGATVKAGELLAEIETPELDQELAEARAQAREAAAAVVQAKAERVEAQADLKVAEAKLQSVRAEVELAQAQFGRREKLLERRAISQEEHETFQRDLTVRNADVAAAESDVVRRRTNLDTRAAIIEAREATALSRQSSVGRLEELQTFKKIVAPFDGVVTRREAEVGMLVTAGEESLFVVEDMSRVRVQLNVPQAHSVQTDVGVEAEIHLPESAAPGVHATITRVADSVDAGSRTMLAEIELDNTASHFQPGSYAQVTLKLRDAAEWTIPANTIDMRVEGPHVAVLNLQNEIEIRPITLGRDLGARVVATTGIHGDERLVVNPTGDLTPGLKVQANEPAANAPAATPPAEIAKR